MNVAMKFKHLTSIVLSLILGCMPMLAEQVEKTPAFPGAEGFGRYTTGGRGGNVYHVTKLTDDGTKGTLRWALAQAGPRTIVFDVSGTIHLTSGLNVTDNTTIAGQTAPGDGICIADYPFQIRGDNVIIRYLRIRLGNKNVLKDGADGWDGFGALDSSDIIIDHCSVSWSIDECLSVLGNERTTVQWCLVAQSLVNSGHSKGAHGFGGNWGGAGASFHHNLIIHHTSRTPRLGPRPTTQLDERMDMRNNVMYNFGGNGCYGGEGMKVNIVNNYYKPGPGTPTDKKGKRIAAIGIRTESYCKTYPDYRPALHLWGRYFVEGNVNSKYSDVTNDNWTYGMYNQIDTSKSATDGTWNEQVKKDIKLSEPIDYVYVNTHSAEDAYAKVMDYVGCSLHRDSFDDLMIYDCENGKATYTGSKLSKGFINSQDDNKPADAPADWSAWPTLETTDQLTDTDGDGMPDEWEIANGLDPENRADGPVMAADGYTNLEHYLNSIVEHITEAQLEYAEASGDITYRDPMPEYYLVDGTTRIESSTSFSNGITVSNSGNGSYNARSEYVGYARDYQHTFSIPAGAYVWRVKFEGMGRYNAGTNYTDPSLVELAGKEYAVGTYTLPAGASNHGEFTIDLDEPFPSNTLTMTWKGNNPFLRIYLYVTDKPLSGVESVVVDAEEGDDAWYTLQGVRLESKPEMPGIYIHCGRKIAIR